MSQDKYPELRDVPEHVLDKADKVYQERRGDYDANEAKDAYRARRDYKRICDEIEGKQ